MIKIVYHEMGNFLSQTMMQIMIQ